jgi:hypothetical protein
MFELKTDRPAEDLPHGCRCGARWSGLRVAHCSVCHVSFSGVNTFDRHRKDGACRTPAEMGMRPLEGRTSEVWGWPTTQSDED